MMLNINLEIKILMNKLITVELTETDLHTIYKMADCCLDMCEKRQWQNVSKEEQHEIGAFMDSASILLDRLNKQLKEE